MARRGDILDTPLLRLNKRDFLTVREACQNFHVFGGIGSGKTSGSMANIAESLLKMGFGGLVLCAKPDELATWQAYAKETGRRLIVFGEEGGFNVLSYLMARHGFDGIGSVVDTIMRIIEAARVASGNGGRGGEQFWTDAVIQLLRATVPIVYSGYGRLNFGDILRFIHSAPRSSEELRSAEWQARSFMFHTLAKARRDPVIPLNEASFNQIASYWHDDFARAPERTRGGVIMTVTAALDRFMHGRLAKAFSTTTTLVPEQCFNGDIIVLNMPALTWNEDGIIAQILFKFVWQRAVLARNALPPQFRSLPVFLWVDEAHYFITEFDAEFLSTGRSSRVCTVFATQSLPTYYARMSGENAKHKTDMLLANFQTKIFHNNSCPETNRFAADTIGRSIQRRGNYNESHNSGWSSGMNVGTNDSFGQSRSSGTTVDAHGNASFSFTSGSNWSKGDSQGRNRGYSSGESTGQGYSEAMDYELEPAVFARELLTGGPANGGRVTAIWFSAGKCFQATGRNWLPVMFQQK